MSRIVIPKQFRVNDPYQQRVLQFDTTDSRVYLSRVSNYILKSIGNNAVIKGFDISNINVTNNIFSCTISPGLLIQDSTLIETSESFTLDLDISGFDSCSGYLILYTTYRYIYSTEENQIKFKLSYITKDGLTMSPITDSWNENSNKIYLNLYRFDKDFNIREIEFPNFFYINGSKYFKRGRLNFIPIDNSGSSIDVEYYELLHSLNTFKIFSQLYDNDTYFRTINTLKLKNEFEIDLNIDEYKPFENNFKLNLADPNDCYLFTVNSIDFENDICTLQHNLNQDRLMVQIYDNENNLVAARSIILFNSNILKIDFRNINDKQTTYNVVILKENLYVYTLLEEDMIFDEVFIQHNLERTHLLIQIVDKTTNTILNNTDFIKVYDENNLLLDKTFCNFVSSDYDIILYHNIKMIFNLFSNNTYNYSYHYFILRFKNTDLTNSRIELNHNLNSKYNIVEIIDKDNNIVVPNNIIAVDNNNCILEFDNIYDEELIAVLYNYTQNNIYTLTESTSASVYSLDLNDIIETTPPIFQFYNSEDYQVIPNYITKDNNIYNFGFDEDDIKAIVGVGFRKYFGEINITESSIINIAHNLETLFPIIQIYLEDNIIYPNNINIVNENSILLDLAAPGNYKINIISGLEKQKIEYRKENSYVLEYDYSDLDINKILIVTHNLNSKYLIVQTYDNNNEIFEPQSIKIINENQIQINLSNITIIDFYKIIIIKTY